ncbi:MAG: tRNA threonylcarbamoyladenosine dehydratase [Peptococcaceae bacterium]|nr:tRNA threonylcarbamoyladenosine dehydratase [Peptococcaceae bacterium]
MAEIYDRTRMLVGDAGMEKLQNAHVFIAGIGGVGSFTAEALARAGVGTLTLLDNDTVDITNLNRQIHATQKTVGRPKVEVMAERIREINPDIQVHTINAFLLDDNTESVLGDGGYDYIVDAVDTVTAKLSLILYARERNIPVISSMGTANKLDATKFEVVDISKTHTCPLARVMRKELRDRGIISGVEVLYSTALPVKIQTAADAEDGERKKPVPASISYVPSVAGLLLAGHVIQQLLAANSR